MSFVSSIALYCGCHSSPEDIRVFMRIYLTASSGVGVELNNLGS